MVRRMGEQPGPEPPHWNQPGGPFLPIDHPAIAGRERELRRLTDAVRRVVHATVTTVPPAGVAAAATARLAAVADELAACRPGSPLPRFAATSVPGRPHVGSPFDVVHGIHNPIALPLRMRDEVVDGRPTAVGDAVFGAPYEGLPGLVDDAVLVGCFDMVLSGANRLAGLGGPTMRLAARHHRPTRLQVRCRFEGWFVARGDRGRLHTEGRLVQEGEVTVTVEGTFRELPRELIERFAEDRP
jgi:hypothetical protein